MEYPDSPLLPLINLRELLYYRLGKYEQSLKLHRVLKIAFMQIEDNINRANL